MIPARYAGIPQMFPHAQPGEPMFSRSAVVGNLVFCHNVSARTVATGRIETDSFEEQARLMLNQVRTNLDQAGGSLKTLIKTCYFFRDMDAHYATMRRLESEYYQHYAPSLAADPPASTVCMADLEDPRCLVEVDALGVVSPERPGWELMKYSAYYGGVKFAYPHVPAGHPMFSRSALVGNLIFCSGAAGLALGSFAQSSHAVADQMRVTMAQDQDVHGTSRQSPGERREDEHLPERYRGSSSNQRK